MISATVFFLLIVGVQSTYDYSICDAYLQLEANTPCGSTGYAMNFGYPICKAFIRNERIFTESGQKFCDCVRPCLANFISANITKHITNCTEITDDAFASHVPCYDKCGFCDIVIDNTPQFGVTFAPYWKAFASKIAIQQVVTVGAGCLSDPIGFALSAFYFGLPL